MSITIINKCGFNLAIPGVEPALEIDEERAIQTLSSEVVDAARNGYIEIADTAPAATLAAEEEGQTAFALPFKWPGDSLVLVSKDGVALVPTTDYSVSLDGKTLTYGHDDLEEGDELLLTLLPGVVAGAFVAPGSISADRFDSDAQAILGKVTWGSPTTDSGVRKTSRLQLVDADGTPLAKAAVLRITCSDGGTISVGTKGSLLSGAGADAICETASDGKLDVRINCTQTKTITVIAGPTQGSPIVDCSESVDMVFGA